MRMDKNEIKQIIKGLRKERDKLVKKYGNDNIHIEINLEDLNGNIMEVNPFSLDLRSGFYYGRDLIDGEFKRAYFWGH